MGAAEYPPYRVFEAQDLFVLDGLSYEAVSKSTGIPMSTLKRWGKKFSWQAKRSELRQAESDARSDTIRLRARLVRDCLAAEKVKAFDVFAVAKMEEAAREAERLQLEKRSLLAFDQQAIDLDSLSATDAVAALEKAIVSKIATMLTDPARLELKNVGEVRRALELVLAAREADEKAGSGKKPLSEDTRTRLKAALGLLEEPQPGCDGGGQ